jgi:hypothetical protein
LESLEKKDDGTEDNIGEKRSFEALEDDTDNSSITGIGDLETERAISTAHMPCKFWKEKFSKLYLASQI